MHNLTFWFTFQGGGVGGYSKFDFLVLPFFYTLFSIF
jgi:hypothetical protein